MNDPKSHLEEITTYWSAIRDPNQFVLRYATAIRGYLTALLGDATAAEDAAQEFYVNGLRRGFVRNTEIRGRFRDYLKAAVRNAARSAQRHGTVTTPLPADLGTTSAADAEWNAQWCRCATERAWLELERYQRKTPGSLAHTVLKLALEWPNEDSVALAQRASASAGRVLQPDAFRKQLSRARQRFAEILLQIVAETLTDATPEQIDDELAELGLLALVRSYVASEPLA